jgi:hypothetical protein
MNGTTYLKKLTTTIKKGRWSNIKYFHGHKYVGLGYFHLPHVNVILIKEKVQMNIVYLNSYSGFMFGT